MRVGISGHQNIGSPETVAWVRRQMLEYLGTHNLSVGISSLAVGADQMFASVVLEMRRALEVVVPCEGYEETFTNPEALAEYRAFLSATTKTHSLDFPQPSEEAFYRAGCLVVDLSDAMVLVWDGKPPAGRGGTGDIAKYVSERRGSCFWINPRSTTASEVRLTEEM
jgi:hypothetical protein